jgi:hypothetical protein
LSSQLIRNCLMTPLLPCFRRASVICPSFTLQNVSCIFILPYNREYSILESHYQYQSLHN